MGRRLSVCLALASLGSIGSIGCSEHRYGFFGDEEASGSGATEPTDTTGPGPTTVSPTTVSPTTVDPTTPDPSGPGTLTLTSEPTTLTSDPTSDPTADPTTTPTCGEVELPSVVPIESFADNSGGLDVFESPCNVGGGPESVWLWTAPFAGEFEFNTFGSPIDTVLTVLEGACGGPSLGCNDDTVQLWSQVRAKLTAGAVVTISVEGLGGGTGPINLNVLQVAEPGCDAFELVSDVGVFPGSTDGAASVHSSQCGGASAPEVVFRWTPPFSGNFVFRTFGSNYDPLLYVRRGGCDGEELACNDDFDSLESQIALFVGPADGPLFIFVDGVFASGDFNLEIAAQ